MTEYEYATKRDRCWHAILQYAFKTPEKFRMQKVYDEQLGEDSDINYSTLRRTARGMQELGWLSRQSEKAQNWERGILADLLLAERGFRTDAIEGQEAAVMEDEELRDIALLLTVQDSLDMLRDDAIEKELIENTQERTKKLAEDIEE